MCPPQKYESVFVLNLSLIVSKYQDQVLQSILLSAHYIGQNLHCERLEDWCQIEAQISTFKIMNKQ